MKEKNVPSEMYVSYLNDNEQAQTIKKSTIRSVGVFDSGIGGLTVLKEILKILPNEDYIYYSDSKNNPYGDKTDKEILEICDNIVQYLLKRNCKAIVIACNTASAKAVSYLRKKYMRNPFCSNRTSL